MSDEPELPITPTNEGRKQKLKNFGYEVPFASLWPMAVGAGVTALFAMVFFVGGFRPFHWAVCLVISVAPLAGAHYYIKKFVEGALPHYQEDVFAGLMCLRPDWNSPSKRFVLLPTWRKELAMAAVPPWHAGIQHPLIRLKKQLEQKKK